MADKGSEKTKQPPGPPLDCFDLSYVTTMLTANGLRDKSFVPIKGGGAFQLAGLMTQRTGKAPRRIIFEKFFKTFASDLEPALENRGALVANWIVSQYAPRSYHHIILGPPLGSMAYLSSVLDAPFLPLDYRIAIRHDKRIHPDHTAEHAARFKEIGSKLLERDPDVELVCEFDPVHERLRVSNASLVRFKFTSLPRSYQQFIRTRLAPGGTVILVESRTGWTQFKVADRLFFQPGLSGGIPDEEFMRSSKRLADFRERYTGDEKAAYRIKAPSEVMPESRFGVTPVLRTNIMNALEQMKRPLCHLFTGDINQLNSLVASLFVRCARREGKRPRRFFIHSGIFLAPLECMNSMLLPLWMPDSSIPSYNFASQFLQSYPYESDASFLALEPSLAGPPDVMEFKKWQTLAEKKGAVQVIGNKPGLFPYDFSSYFLFWQSMQNASRRNPDPLDVRVNLDMLIEEAENCRIYFTMYQR